MKTKNNHKIKQLIPSVLLGIAAIFLSILSPVWIYLIFKKSNWTNKTKWAVSSVSASLFIIFVIAIIASLGTPVFAKVPSLTNQKQIEISATGAYDNAKIEIYQSGNKTNELTSDSGGKFKFTVTLNEGENKIKASASNDKGKTKTSSEAKIVLDTIAPQLTLDQITSPVSTDGVEIKGASEKDAEVSVTKNNEEVTKSRIKSDTFTLSGVKLNEGENKFAVRAKDPAGNESEIKEIVVVYNKPVEVKPAESTIAATKPSAESTPAETVVKTTGCKITNYLPDKECDPGATDPRVTQGNLSTTICKSGYTDTVRPSSSVTDKMKIIDMIAYGFTDSKSNYEYDHIIALELGGSPADTRNLFPEPYAEPYGARDKDKVENKLKALVCAGSMTLSEAQKEISTDWVSVYIRYYGSEATANQPATAPATKAPASSAKAPVTTDGPQVKKSTSSICHEKGVSQYYNQTKNYTSYNSISDCLASGGRLPK